MKKRILSWSLAFAMALSLATIPAAAAETATPAVSNSYLHFRYRYPINTNLFQNASGGLTRVEYYRVEGEPLITRDENSIRYEARSTPWVTVEEYDSNFQMTRCIRIVPELPAWGGVFAGQNYNFLIYGATNYTEDDNAEVIRVVKYTKDWQRLGHASLRGANTVVPFEAGSLRAAESGDYLYIHTAHEMYTSEDKLRHQANLTFAVQQSTMEITDAAYHISNSRTGYVSHSFNQFVLVDTAGHLVTLDHGDGYPRGIRLARYYADADTGKFTTSTPDGICKIDMLVEFPGEVGDNDTGAVLGGLAETTNGYVAAYCYDGTGGAGGTQRPYLSYVDKQSGQIRNTPVSSTGATAPFLVPNGLSGGYMLWNGTAGEKDTLYYLTYSADGTTGPVQTATAPLYDCPPIYYNGKVVWYITNNSVPTFYTLDSSGVTTHIASGSAVLEEQTTQTTAPNPVPTPESNPTSNPGGTASFSDVPANHWAYAYVEEAADNGWVNGIGNGLFGVDNQVTYAEFSTMLVRAFYPDLPEDYGPTEYLWYEPYYHGLRSMSLDRGTVIYDDTGDSAPGWPVNRYDMAQILYNILKWEHVSFNYNAASVQAGISDWSSVPSNYREALTAVVGTGLITGVDDRGTFNGNGCMTRGQAAIVMCRMADIMEAAGAI